jgi:hypothetical protein
MTVARVLTTAIFFASAHAAVAMGFIPLLVLMAGIFWVAIKIENHDRAIKGRPPYSWYDAGRDVKQTDVGDARSLRGGWQEQ